MSRIATRTTPSARWFHRPARFVCLGMLSLGAPLAQAGADGPLNFFKNYFVTGDYQVGGVGIRGTGAPDSTTAAITGTTGTLYTSYAQGTIHFDAAHGNVIPANANGGNVGIVAAFLYWETIVPTGTDLTNQALATGLFRGFKIVGTQLAAQPALACWGSGGGNGSSQQSQAQTLLVYRADVLRYLPVVTVPAGQPFNGEPLTERMVNDADLMANNFPLTTVKLLDAGGGGSTSPSSGNQTFQTLGASLVVVYRLPTDPLRAVVIYNGGFRFASVNGTVSTLTQNIQGFYEASKTSPVAKMTHIVGGGRNFQEQLSFGATQLTPQNSAVPSATDPFPGAQGPTWDNLTVSVGGFMSGDDSSVSTSVTGAGPNSSACLTWGAILFSTTVQNSGGDGILDKWKTTSGLMDPLGATLPTLSGNGANGAKVGQKDIFVEIDYMNSSDYFSGVSGHTHLPTQTALDMVGDAFAARGIHIHFDVGNKYQTAWIAGCPAPNGSMLCDPYIIPFGLGTSGSDSITETSCAGPQSTSCMFPTTPGTVNWKPGLETIASFGHAKKDIFHHALFAHALGIPKWRVNNKTLTQIVVSGGIATITTGSPHGLSTGNTVTIVGAPVGPIDSMLNGTWTPITVTSPTTFTVSTTASDGTYNNWGLGVSNGTPPSISGTSDVAGGDLMISLGLWDNQVGTDFMQASTLFHELGHNLGLEHGGDIADGNNCKPNYLSSMSYLFQARGLLTPDGVPHIDYSGQKLPTLDEFSLDESRGFGVAALPYLPRWFAPFSTSFVDVAVGTTPATKHCDGTPLIATDPVGGTVRIDGTSLVASTIDWNGNGNTSDILTQDINFSGAIDTLSTNPPNPLNGFNDWAAINLQQVGGKRNILGFSLDVVSGDDVQFDQVVAANKGLDDLDGGLGVGGGGNGVGGGGNGVGGGGNGVGGGGNGVGGGGNGVGGGGNGAELDFDQAKAVGNSPNALTATVVGKDIDLNWGICGGKPCPPNAGTATQYQIWRATCPNKATLTNPCSLSPSIPLSQIGLFIPAGQPGATPPCDGGFNFCDTKTQGNTVYLYFVTATLVDNTPNPPVTTHSGRSNIRAAER